MRHAQRLARFLAVALALGLTGCASQTVIKTVLDVQPTVNPDTRGRPSPIVVRLYVLKSPTTFITSDFFSVFEKEQATLGADLLEREELQLMPGDMRKFQKQIAPEALYIGVIAGFRDLERSQWRSAIAVKPKKTNQLRIWLDANRVILMPN